VLVPQFFGSLIFDRRSSRYLPFDQESTGVLQELADLPFDALHARWAGERDAASVAALEAFYEGLDALGFFTLDRRLAAAILDVSPPPDHLTGPLAVHLEVAASCNLACAHCFAGDLPRREAQLSLAESDALFAEMAAMGSFRLGLTGGEPLLRRDLFDIIDLAISHGLHPCVTTNGLREHARFTLAFTIMKTNLHEIEQCIALAASVGASTAVFRPLYPVGVATRHLDELMPSFAEYSDALARIASASGAGAGLADGFDLRHTHGSRLRNWLCASPGRTVASLTGSRVRRNGRRRHGAAYPANGKQRVLRGGSWTDGPEMITVSFRSSRGSSPWQLISPIMEVFGLAQAGRAHIEAIAALVVGVSFPRINMEAPGLHPLDPIT
jgi:hypothetical protein